MGQDSSQTGQADYYLAQVFSANLYYPFGWEMPGRKFVSGEGYRFGFNGKETDEDATSGSYDFGARMYSSQLGRWWSTDPLEAKYPHISPYAFVGNMPIRAVDPDGQKIIIVGGRKYRRQVMRHLRKLAANSKTGRKLLRKAINSKHELIIYDGGQAEIAVSGWQPSFEAQQKGIKVAALSFNLKKAQKNLDPSNGRNGKALKNPEEVILGHELHHFSDMLDGKISADPRDAAVDPKDPLKDQTDPNTGATGKVPKDVDIDEITAVDTENKVRAEMGYDLRTHYGGVNVFNKTHSKKKHNLGYFNRYYILDKTNPTNYDEYRENNSVDKGTSFSPAGQAFFDHNFKKTESNKAVTRGIRRVKQGNLGTSGDSGSTTLQKYK